MHFVFDSVIVCHSFVLSGIQHDEIAVAFLEFHNLSVQVIYELKADAIKLGFIAMVIVKTCHFDALACCVGGHFKWAGSIQNSTSPVSTGFFTGFFREDYSIWSR